MDNKLHIFFIFYILLMPLNLQSIKVLHLSFHPGCIKDFEYVAKKLNLELISKFAQEPAWLDGETCNINIWNITHERANKAWQKNKDFFNKFDVIITSDTAPLARIFLQNEWKKPLIIWVCNRFDYADMSSQDGSFPDNEYYELFRKAEHQPNVKIICYTSFEYIYAKNKGVDLGLNIIKPCAYPNNEYTISCIPAHVEKNKTFFIPPYHNDTIYMNLAQHCHSLAIPVYAGRYNGPGDLKDFKGIIHLPYAWSNVAFFENILNGIPYFIPSKKFLFELMSKGPYWFQDSMFLKHLDASEWYTKENQEFIVYFDSWNDLVDKIQNTDFQKLKNDIINAALNHHNIMMKRWESVFKEL